MSSTNTTSILPWSILQKSSIPIPMETLTATMAEWKDGHGKAIIICRSTFSTISVIASFVLIRMIFSSKKRLSTPYHRLMLGLSIGDILFSITHATFGLTSPSDMSYLEWNASGNKATCSAEGFICTVGLALTLCYSCSLNLYSLAAVKYHKSDTYIRTKREPFLHGVPILIALVGGVIGLANDNYNNPGRSTCMSFTYNPPHCTGYEDGQVPEGGGFKIPCGRGRNPEVIYTFRAILISVAPTIMFVSMGMIYRSVSKQEKKMSRFGAGTLNPSTQQSPPSNTNRDNSYSRVVLHKALAYTIAYYLTWGWAIAGETMVLAGKEVPLTLSYMWTIFESLQGLYNLLIFMHPKVLAVKKSQGGDLSWGKAFATSFWSGVGFVKSKNKENTQPAGAKKNAPVIDGSRTHTAVNSTPTGGGSSMSRSGNKPSHDHTKSPGTVEEEKHEIQAHVGSGDDLESI